MRWAAHPRRKSPWPSTLIPRSMPNEQSSTTQQQRGRSDQYSDFQKFPITYVLAFPAQRDEPQDRRERSRDREIRTEIHTDHQRVSNELRNVILHRPPGQQANRQIVSDIAQNRHAERTRKSARQRR